MREVMLITGASGGIGAALAHVFAADGRDLALVARSRDRLEAEADRIAASGRPRPLLLDLDLAEAGAADRLAQALAQAGARVCALVNNAGFGLTGLAMDLPRAEQVAMVDLNIRALVDLTLRFLPDITQARGGILNVASTASFQPGPGMAVYYATKAFVLSFSEALSYELRPKGVAVTALCPGPTRSGFQERAGMDVALFDIITPMEAQEVARAGLAAFKRGERVAVPGLLNRLIAWSAPFTPRALAMPAIARLQARRKGDG